MSGTSKMLFVDESVSKDRLNVVKTKGIETIVSTINVVSGIADSADSIVAFGKDVKSLGLKWNAKLSLLPLYNSVLAETGADNRMFVRKAERGGFENLHKLFTKLAGESAAPDFVQIDVETYTELEGITASFEEQTRMINAIINAVKAACPECKIILGTKESTDNEKAKKWYNRFQVSGGKHFDIISLSYELSADTFYDLSCNMSDLSRRFEADIIVDISSQDDITSSDIGLEDLDSAISIVPLERGFGAVYSDKIMERATMVA